VYQVLKARVRAQSIEPRPQQCTRIKPPSRVQPSLIFPVPCEFIGADLPHCAVIRPSDDKFAGAVATIASFTADGLFVGQSPKFLQTVNRLAEEADAATRQI
jgi:hypothetical protein